MFPTFHPLFPTFHHPHTHPLPRVDHLYVPWLFQICRDSFLSAIACWYVSWLIHGLICMWDMTHARMAYSCVVHMNESQFLWMGRDLYVQCDPESRCIYFVTTILSFMDESPFFFDWFLRDMTRSYVTWIIPTWHDLFLCDVTYRYMTWLIPRWRESFRRDMTRSYVTWLIPTWHDAWLIPTWRESLLLDMQHCYVFHSSIVGCIVCYHTHCNTLQHTATHCNTRWMYRVTMQDSLQHTTIYL